MFSLDPLLGGTSLADGLAAFWNCDEASGNLVDALGRTDLTAVNSPGATTGVIKGARVCDQATAAYFSRASSVYTNTGTGSFSGSLWFYSTDAAKFFTRQRFIGNYNSGVLGGYSFFMGRPGGTQTLTLECQNAGVQSDINLATGDTLNGWTWMYFEWNADTGKRYIRLKSKDLGLDLSSGPTAYSGPSANDTSVPFAVGAYQSSAQAALGNIDMVGFWNTRVLTTLEQDLLYNNGSGLQYPF